MLLATLVISSVVTVLMMLALRPVAHATGMVDKPGGRKRHVGDVPVIGGTAMFLGVAIGMALLPGLQVEDYLLLVAGGLLVGIGIIDDRFGLPATVRLIAQFAAVLIMVFGAGLLMRDIGDPLWVGRIVLGPFALVATTLIFATVINAYNLVDGLDGLAGGMALIAVSAIAYVAGPSTSTGAMALIVAAAIVGYLIFNFPYGGPRPFRAFMGDSGSTFLGISIVWLTVSVCQGPDRVISPVHGLLFAALPIWDLLTCFVRRIKSGRSPFHSGRDHFHHLLRNAGMSVRRAVSTLLALQFLYAAFGIASLEMGVAESAVFSVWAVLGLTQLLIIRAIANAYAGSLRRKATN